MIVRPAQSDDLDQLSFDETSRLARALGDSESRAVVAVGDQGPVVGIAISRLGVVHRTRRWLDVLVSHDHRRRGIGTSLVRALAQQHDDGRAFAAKAIENSPAARFCTALGGTPYQVCPAMTMHRDDAVLLPQFSDTPQDRSSGFLTVAGRDLGRTHLADLWLTQYEWIHRSWSPVDDSDAARQAVRRLADDLDLDLTSVVLRETLPFAAAFAFSDASKPAVVEIIAETVEPSTDAAGLPAVRRAVGRSVRLAVAGGAERVEFDGHLSDPHFALLAAMLPLVGGRVVLFELSP